MASALGLDFDIALSGTQNCIYDMLRGGRQNNDRWSVSQTEVVGLSERREASRIGKADRDVLSA